MYVGRNMALYDGLTAGCIFLIWRTFRICSKLTQCLEKHRIDTVGRFYPSNAAILRKKRLSACIRVCPCLPMPIWIIRLTDAAPKHTTRKVLDVHGCHPTLDLRLREYASLLSGKMINRDECHSTRKLLGVTH